MGQEILDRSGAADDAEPDTPLLWVIREQAGLTPRVLSPPAVPPEYRESQ